MVLNRSEPDLLRSAMNRTHTITSTPLAQNRARSQSSPHTLNMDGPMQTPSSGKAVQPSPLALQRQNSYHGTSPSPRRPAPPSRANSSQGPFRRSRPGSLAASAFGITPIEGGLGSPLASPTGGRPVTGGSTAINAHARHRSEACLTPFTASMQGMTISPDGTPGDLSLTASTSSVTTLPMPMSVPPLTPITPGHVGNSGVFPTLTPEFGDFGDHLANFQQPQQYYQSHPQQMQQWQQWNQQFQAQQYAAAGMPTQGQAAEVPLAMPIPSYATMPNKHFGMESYEGYPAGEFGQAFPAKQEQQDQKWQ